VAGSSRKLRPNHEPGETSMLVRCLAMTVLVAVGALALPGEAQAQYVVRCESVDFRENYCSVDTRGGVRIVRQVSESDCYEGETWGFDRRGIWVSGGCAGDFEILGRGHGRPGYGGGYGQGGGHYQPPGHGGGATIVCESRDFHYNYCGVRVRRGVQIVEQISRTECVEGRTWGWDRGGVWVDQGCKAAFTVF
jgi:hypothetical protein